MRLPSWFRWCLILLLLCLPTLRAQDDTGGRVLLVLPFDNRSGQANLDWIGESFAETIAQRLSSVGYLTISRADRDYALDHLGLPLGFRPSRATTLRIAQTLDAEYVVVGRFNVANGRVESEAQVIQVNQLRMSAPLKDTTDLPRLLDLENSVAWKCAREIDPHFSVALGTFQAASQGIRLDAYENYIRGISAQNSDERIKRLKAAVAAQPGYIAAVLALGRAQYAARDYDAAAATLAKVPATDPAALEANFYRGLARFNYAKYAEAEGAFGFVASRLPLPEVVNDEGVAQARQKKDGTALLQRASAADPQDPDYHYNVAVSLRRRGNLPQARAQAEQALKLRPQDNEAKLLAGVLAGTTQAPAGYDPQERIRRTYSEAGVRQAAFQLDRMREAKDEALPPAARAIVLAQSGQEYLNNGLLLEAEREFQHAIAADPRSPEAHLGLALVRERSGNAGEARTEAQQSISLKPTVAAYLVLARLDLQSNQLPASASDTANALRLEPNNAAALGMRQALQSRGQALP
ncbi:tetratricopeptide repeat protein [Terriglobus sp.]|uniref:tetratricopeptide repeat protein n=1 Tax=Terriglobus sp. TaxID=1889013 RepID=UPI003AFFF027